MARIEGAPKEKFVPISQRLSDALKGWDKERATALELDLVCHKVRDVYAQMTWGDLIIDYDRLSSNTSSLELKENYHYIVRKKNSIQTIHKYHLENSQISDFKDGIAVENPDDRYFLYRIVIEKTLGKDLYEWLEKALKTKDHSLVAQAVYIIFNTENPFLYISPKVTSFIKKMEDKFKIMPEFPELTEKGFGKIEHFIQELNFATHADFLNDWGYCQEVGETYFGLLRDNEIGSLLFKDTILLANNEQSTLFPAQIFNFFEQIIRMYPNTKNYDQAIKQFYKEHPEGIHQYFNGKTNIIITGAQRSLEHLSLSEEGIEPGKILLALFSGPPEISLQEASYTACRKCITVDREGEEVLKSIENGGQASFVRNELLPNQKRDNKHFFRGNFKQGISLIHTHIKGDLPKDKKNIEKIFGKDISKLSVITDKRGSLLYLKGNKLLEHLRWIFEIANKNPDVLVYLSRGISTNMLIDLIIQNRYDHWGISYGISSFRMNERLILPTDGIALEGVAGETSFPIIILDRLNKSLRLENKFTYQEKISMAFIIFCSVLGLCGKNLDELFSQSGGGMDIDSFYQTFFQKEKNLFENKSHLFAEQLLIFYRKMLLGDNKEQAIVELKEKIGTKIDPAYINMVTRYPMEYVYEIIDSIIHFNEISTSLQGINASEFNKFADRLDYI
ncbi:MAG: hypothetical protein UR68_C0009G0010 [Candidatus Roizmanbacteria bacterium GW2011_GWA2_35_19]|uniref:Uncharacterized protein n=2 Tax=Candidatus Roizmaniibacteriota TaxID=1752723 RepID=A0A0G0ECV9_9BACT|nr:MAG: hypothetical protein UR63_C0004G0010 [Candidatus Roizmanbacteria bacterium GW2011_GWC2_35_12]KKP73065.1 MAG: hypothetical protein UR68_C0009G0010 [Candidatus Roizmanbacteria bacterium GW2011_GWA2_35_19]